MRGEKETSKNDVGEATSQPCDFEEGKGGNYKYMNGLGNHLETECYPGALPQHRNNPKVCPFDLYAEQLSGTAFTCPRSVNQRTWLYRVQPSISFLASSSNQKDGNFQPYAKLPIFGSTSNNNCSSSSLCTSDLDHDREFQLDPNPLRWDPIELQSKPTDANDSDAVHHDDSKAVNFVEGCQTMMMNGDPTAKRGLCIHVYAFNTNMRRTTNEEIPQDMYMYNSDGDFLIVPQQGILDIQTEMGRMMVCPKEICVIPRGIVFTINHHPPLHTTTSPMNFARGYILEIFEGHFHLPELGPIGSNGLANARDFQIPTAYYDHYHPTSLKINDKDKTSISTTGILLNKFGRQLFHKKIHVSPFNVVAWQGNYYPFKYNLSHFCTMNSVSYDHPDPSIYTVLTVSSSSHHPTALADFVVFPPRVMATDANTFRPPWFHRNCMSEFMGLIEGQYDAKSNDDDSHGGFVPGGVSFHNIMTPHGPDTATFHKATAKSKNDGVPSRYDGGLAFMFETSLLLKVSKTALQRKQSSYIKCWNGLDAKFFDHHNTP